MPTEDGRFKGMSVPADAWERIFGQHEEPIRSPEDIARIKKDWDSPALLSQFYEEPDEAR